MKKMLKNTFKNNIPRISEGSIQRRNAAQERGRGLLGNLSWNSRMAISALERFSNAPRRLTGIVAHPIYQILKFVVKISGIQDLVHLKLRKTIYLGRKRGGHDAIRERVRHMRFQEADMEHRMDV